MSGTYRLKDIKDLIRANSYTVTGTAADTARRDFNLEESEILDLVLELREQDFDKTMPSEKNPELWQDVYKPRIVVDRKIVKAYVKVQIAEPPAGKKTVVVSFKKA